MTSPLIDRVVTSGKFTLDGGTWDVDNNVWLVGDSREVIVIDAAHDALAIVRAIGDREVLAIVCTHAHNDHINAARELSKATGAPVLLHPADDVLWQQEHPSWTYSPLSDNEVLSVGGVDLHVLHTPGHSPGAVCVYAPRLNAVFTGDTLFEGGPGATGRSHSDKPTILKSIRERLLTLPPETEVHTGHGDSTTIGAEADNIT